MRKNIATGKKNYFIENLNEKETANRKNLKGKIGKKYCTSKEGWRLKPITEKQP